MSEKVKIFLSHSSVDKAFVGRVYRELGAGLCHYDVATFDRAGSIAQEIFDALVSSTHFVLFASPTALASGWVRSEMQRAFEGWMSGGIQKAMVFLLDGATIEQVPAWLRRRVIAEPPSWRHVVCRIQTEVERADPTAQPPYYGADLASMETRVLNVEAARLPGAILVYGPDGSGRKRTLNELYQRQFPNVLPRKILIPMTEFSTEVELYREIVGHMRIATITEFNEVFQAFEALDPGERFDRLAAEVVRCSEANECLILDCDRSLLTDDGRLPNWLLQLARRLIGQDYPRLTVTTTRRPRDVSVVEVTGLLVQEIHALDREHSETLFNWWLRKLGQPYQVGLKEVVFEACSGNPKQLELGAKALVEAGAGRIEKIRPELLRTLEGASRQVLDVFATRTPHCVILAFVANAGFPTRSDVLQYFSDASIATVEVLNEAIEDCLSCGFLVEDEVCIWMPEYLQRGARAIGRGEGISTQLGQLWKLQADRFQSLKVDDLTSVPVLNEYCLAFLRVGANDGSIFDNILLGSQCLRVAKTMYDRKEYENAIRLCEMAYGRRGTLTEDGVIEGLRYMGLSAARLNRQDQLTEVFGRLGDLGKSTKAMRIGSFLKGFNARLDGNYDAAKTHLTEAYKRHGEHDLHILRELAYISLQMDDLPSARHYLRGAMQRAGSNPYVLELAVRLELVGTPAAVASRASEIDGLMSRLRSFDLSQDKYYWYQMACERHLALNDVDAASQLLERPPLRDSASPAVKLIKARLLTFRKQFLAANAILEPLRESVSKRSGAQRKSLLPVVTRLLVESVAAADVERGVERFLSVHGDLPQDVQRKLAKNLLDNVAYSHVRLSDMLINQLKRVAQVK